LCTKCKPCLFNFDMKRLNLRLEAWQVIFSS